MYIPTTISVNLPGRGNGQVIVHTGNMTAETIEYIFRRGLEELAANAAAAHKDLGAKDEAGRKKLQELESNQVRTAGRRSDLEETVWRRELATLVAQLTRTTKGEATKKLKELDCDEMGDLLVGLLVERHGERGELAWTGHILPKLEQAIELEKSRRETVTLSELGQLLAD